MFAGSKGELRSMPCSMGAIAVSRLESVQCELIKRSTVTQSQMKSMSQVFCLAQDSASCGSVVINMALVITGHEQKPVDVTLRFSIACGDAADRKWLARSEGQRLGSSYHTQYAWVH